MKHWMLRLVMEPESVRLHGVLDGMSVHELVALFHQRVTGLIVQLGRVRHRLMDEMVPWLVVETLIMKGVFTDDAVPRLVMKLVSVRCLFVDPRMLWHIVETPQLGQNLI